MKESKDEQIKIYRLGKEKGFRNVMFLICDTLIGDGYKAMAEAFRMDMMTRVVEQKMEIIVATFNNKLIGFSCVDKKDKSIKMLYVISSLKDSRIKELLQNSSEEYIQNLE